jgi:putative salt-induced outer membrane protein YdiY
MTRILQLVAAASVLLTASAGAQAEGPKPVTFTGDIGFVNTAGNTSVTTLSVGDKLVARAGSLVLTQLFALVYGRSAGEENANSIGFRGRAELPLAGRLSAYGFAGYERNKFAGIARRFDEGVGLALAVVRQPNDELTLEGGAGLVQESRYLSGAEGATLKDSFASGRAALTFLHRFTKTAYFQESAEYLVNLEDTDASRINSESALVAPLSAHLAVKAAYLVKYNSRPLQASLKKTDRFLTTGRQITY